MRTLFKTLALSAVLASSAFGVQAASFGGEGLRMSCAAGQITPRGVWDCR